MTRALTAYNEFVKKEYPSHKHLGSKAAFKEIGAKWQKEKSSRGAGVRRSK